MHYILEDTIHKTFTTRAFATGIPTVLAGSPVVSAYEDDSITQITAGITLGVDHDGVVGLNLLTLVLTAANGYEAGKDYNFVVTTGTVGGVSVVGETVLSISLDRDPAFVRLGAPAGASVSADIAVIEGQTDDIGVAGAGLTAIDLPNQTMDIVGNITGNLSGSVGSVTGSVGSVAGNVDGSTASVTGAVGSVAGNVDGNVTGSVASNLELGPAEVNAEVVDVLFTDTDAEPAKGAPGATISLADKIGFLYKAWRNRSTQNATTYSVFNDDATTVDHDATVSDDTTTADRGEMTDGP